MIKADHKYWARAIFNLYIYNLLKKNFNNFYLVNDLPEITDKKLIIAPNHFSWWDGFFIDLINEKTIKRKFHILMLEEQLKKFWFFNKLGAYGFNPNNAKSTIETVKYTKEILRDKSNLTVIYPQGEISPFEQKPLSIKEGIKYFVRDAESDLVVLPVAFKINFEEEKNPSVYCRFGEPLSADSIKKDFSLFKDAFIENIDLLKDLSLQKIKKYDLLNL